MSEFSIFPAESVNLRRSDELIHLSKTRLATIAQKGLHHIAEHHGRHYTPQPNKLNDVVLHKAGEIPTKDGYGYRRLSGLESKDLVKSGVVRNEGSAKSVNPRPKGNTVNWIIGINDGCINFGLYDAVIEASVEDINLGWVTVDKLTAFHVKMDDEKVVDILPELLLELNEHILDSSGVA